VRIRRDAVAGDGMVGGKQQCTCWSHVGALQSLPGCNVHCQLLESAQAAWRLGELGLASLGSFGGERNGPWHPDRKRIHSRPPGSRPFAYTGMPATIQATLSALAAMC